MIDLLVAGFMGSYFGKRARKAGRSATAAALSAVGLCLGGEISGAVVGGVGSNWATGALIGGALMGLVLGVFAAVMVGLSLSTLRPGDEPVPSQANPAETATPTRVGYCSSCDRQLDSPLPTYECDCGERVHEECRAPHEDAHYAAAARFRERQPAKKKRRKKAAPNAAERGTEQGTDQVAEIEPRS